MSDFSFCSHRDSVDGWLQAIAQLVNESKSQKTGSEKTADFTSISWTHDLPFRFALEANWSSDHIYPGSVLEKKLTGGLGLFFWVWNFWYSYFFGFGKISLIFLGLKIFHLFFGVAILIQFIFLGVRLNDLDLQNHSNNNINEWR